MKPFTRIALFFLMAVAGCGTPGEGFRFDAEYVAEHSRFVLRMAAAGIRPRGGGVGRFQANRRPSCGSGFPAAMIEAEVLSHKNGSYRPTP